MLLAWACALCVPSTANNDWLVQSRLWPANALTSLGDWHLPGSSAACVSQGCTCCQSSAANTHLQITMTATPIPACERDVRVEPREE